MPSPDDPFLQLLASLTGQTVGFRCGSGGLEDALSSYCFLELCGRYGVAVAEAGAPGVATRFRGSVGTALGAKAGPEIVLPLGGSRVEAAADLLQGDVTLFCCDPETLRWAELQGVPHDRRRLCRELAFHVDFADLRFPSAAGEGRVRLAGDGFTAEGGDALAVVLSGAGGRWLSRDRCRDAVQRALAVLDPYAEVVTDSVDVAVLVAKLGRGAVLRIPSGEERLAAASSRLAPERLSIAVETAPGGGPDAHAHAAEPYAPRERETLLLRIAALEERRDVEIAAAVAAAETDRAGERLVRASAVERRVDAAEGRAAEAVASERARAEAAERRAADAEAAALRRDQARADRAEQGSRERDADASRIAALEAAHAAAEQRRQALEGRLGEMQALLDRAAALRAEADAEAAGARARLDALLASSSWRVTRPLRGLVRLLRAPSGSAGR